MRRPSKAADRELAAMSAIIGALDGLDGDSIQRVMDYVMGRLSIGGSSRPKFGSAFGGPLETVAIERKQTSIRDLMQEKQPESSNQMAALVAYYLSELAPEADRKAAITSADLERYFKQAGFKLPSALYNTLPNAASAGYFDTVGRGLYRLNPVGYNLVVHGLPRTTAQQTSTPRLKAKRRKKGTTKR